MSGEYPHSKFVSPAKCAERPWDLWVNELGHSSPRPDEAFAAPAPADKGGASRRHSHSHPYKASERRYRRAGLHRLRHETMSLHGLFPQLDNLNAAICHMCGVIVKCSAAYRHLVESHPGSEPLLPPPPPVATVRSRTRHKKEQPPPSPVERLPVKMGSSPVHTAAAPLSRIVLPQQELQYLDEPGPSSAVTGEVQVCVESGELPVVSIQDTEELPLGENITDDIFAIMNSEGIQSADDITNATDWKNIIRDIGNLQDIHFSQTTDTVQTQDLFAPVTPAPPSYALEPDLSSFHVAAASPLLPVAPVAEPHTQALKPPVTPSTPKSQRSKTSKTKFNLREYDANKHCGVLTAEGKPCTRSLTCKAHALSLRRMVEGRVKPFDTLLAEHRASREAGAAAAAAPPAPAPPPPVVDLPPLLVNTSIDLTAFNGLTSDQQVNDIYSLLNVDDPNSLLADPSAITSLLNQPLPDTFVMPEDIPQPVRPSPVERLERIERHERTERPERSERPDRTDRSDRSERTSSSSRSRDDTTSAPAGDVCWYSSCPRPLALCTFNASHAGSAITLGKKFATVRSNIKSSLSRSQCKSTGATNNFYYGQNALSLSKSVHMNAKTSKPEVRRLIVCSGNSASSAPKEVQQTLNEIFGGDVRPLNGHIAHSPHGMSKGHGAHLAHGTSKAHGAHSAHGTSKVPHKHTKHSTAPVLDLGFSLDPLLADEKC